MNVGTLRTAFPLDSSTRGWRGRLVVTLLAPLGAGIVLPAFVAGQAIPAPQRRPLPPTPWDQAVLDLFPEDATAGLERRTIAAFSPEAAAPPAPMPAGDSAADGVSALGFKWTQVAPAEVVEDEIKSASVALSNSLRSLAAFKNGGFPVAAREFALVAVLLRITTEYDGEIRWHRTAAAVRDKAAAASLACADGTDAAFRVARAASEDLVGLVRGDAPTGEPAPVAASWDQLASRDLLMQRMEQGVRDRISPALANERSFRRERATILHESGLLALLARVLCQPEYDGWDDETFQEHALDLERASLRLREAARQESYARTAEALGAVEASCNSCHQDYRQ